MRHYAFNAGDYAAATAHLSDAEDLAYRRLLDAYYVREAPLPADEAACCRLARATSAAARKAVGVVLREFFAPEADGWHQKRADVEIERYADKAGKARASAMVSVEARARNNADLRKARMAAAREKGTHTADEWRALVDACGAACVQCGAEGATVKDHIVPVYQGGSDAIDNLQPLCTSCNSSKGPATADHRPQNWRASVQRTLSERSTNQKPVTSNQEKPRAESLAASPPTTKRAARLPADWQLPQAWGEWAQAERQWPADEVRRVSALFADHWRGKGEARADWEATWRNWVRRERGNAAPRSDAKTESRNAFAASILGDVNHEQPADRTNVRDITGEAVRVA